MDNVSKSPAKTPEESRALTATGYKMRRIQTAEGWRRSMIKRRSKEKNKQPS
jgi:hypothetical protein